MPRELALALCLVFIAWFLVRDLRRRASVSWAMWLPTLLLLVVASRPVTMWLGFEGVIIGEDAYVEGSPIDRTFYLCLIFGAGLVATWRGVKWNRLLLANGAVTLFYLYFAVSILWSVDPFGSFKRLFKDFGLVVMIAVILSEKDPREAMRALYVRCACVLIPLSVLFVRYYPELGRFYTRSGSATFTGVTTQKNGLGEIVMVFSVVLLWDYLETRSAGTSRSRWDHLVLLVMGLWLLNVSDSQTALACLLIGVVLVVRGRQFASPAINRAAFVAALSAPFWLFFTQQFGTFIAPLVEALGRDLTFTGRTDIWQAILAQDLNPVIGAGYWNFWGPGGGQAVRDYLSTQTMKSAHNGYLDMYLDGGLIALGLLFCLLLAAGSRATRNLREDRFQRVRFAFVVVAILYNLSETTFGRLSPLWLTTLLMFIEFPWLKTVEPEHAPILAAQAVDSPYAGLRATTRRKVHAS
jgi:exopolysaccharide production protein ExoQ